MHRRLYILIITSILILPAFQCKLGDDNEAMQFPPLPVKYHTYDSMSAELQELAENHSNIMRLYVLSKTYEGRNIWAVKISDNPDIQENEPEVLYIGAHHAREWASYEVPLYTIKYILQKYNLPPTDDDNDGVLNEDPFDGKDNDGDGLIDEDEDEARIKFLVDNRQMWFIPMLNPDGTEYCRKQVESGITDESKLWRKNREPNINPVTGEPYPEHIGNRNMWGTDLNRNYGWHWGEIGFESHFDPSREDYMGPYDKHDDDGDGKINEDRMDGIDNDGDGKVDEDTLGGFSTIETCAVRDLLINHSFIILMSYHTYKEEGTYYWPWMYTRQLPPDEELFTIIASRMSKFNGYVFRNYTGTDDNTRRGPLVNGDLNDYAYGKHGILSYCIELKQDKFIVEESELPRLCMENLGPNLLVAEICDDPWDYNFEINHTPLKNTEDTEGPYIVRAKIRSYFGMELMNDSPSLYYSTNGKNYVKIRMIMNDYGEFVGKIPGQKPGTKIRYYIEAESTSNVSTYLPKYPPYQTFTFHVVEYKGEVSLPLLFAHVVLIMAALIAALLAGIFAFLYLRDKDVFHYIVKWSKITVILIFIGGIVVGCIVAYQRYGIPWTGFPVSWDITDNKTLIIFIYWSLTLILIGKTAFLECKYACKLKKYTLIRKFTDRDIISKRKFAFFVLCGTFLTLFVYLIPHSIETHPLASIALLILCTIPFLSILRYRQLP